MKISEKAPQVKLGKNCRIQPRQLHPWGEVQAHNGKHQMWRKHWQQVWRDHRKISLTPMGGGSPMTGCNRPEEHLNLAGMKIRTWNMWPHKENQPSRLLSVFSSSYIFLHVFLCFIIHMSCMYFCVFAVFP